MAYRRMDWATVNFVDKAELGRRLAVYCELELPEVADPVDAGIRLANRLWPLISGYLGTKASFALLWDELRTKFPDVAQQITFASSGATNSDDPPGR